MEEKYLHFERGVNQEGNITYTSKYFGVILKEDEEYEVYYKESGNGVYRYSVDFPLFDNVETILVALSKREEQIETYMKLFQEMETEIGQYQKKMHFQDKNPIRELVICYRGGAGCFYAFRLYPERREVIVLKKLNERSMGSFKRFEYIQFSEGIQILKEQINKYAIKELLKGE